MLEDNSSELSALSKKIGQADSFNLLDELSTEFAEFREAIQDPLMEAEGMEGRGWAMAQASARSPVDRRSEALVPVCQELSGLVTKLKSSIAECDAALVSQRQLLAEIQEVSV
jgi:hypothetical protein